MITKVLEFQPEIEQTFIKKLYYSVPLLSGCKALGHQRLLL